jgi:hypothetical protein
MFKFRFPVRDPQSAGGSRPAPTGTAPVPAVPDLGERPACEALLTYGWWLIQFGVSSGTVLDEVRAYTKRRRFSQDGVDLLCQALSAYAWGRDDAGATSGGRNLAAVRFCALQQAMLTCGWTCLDPAPYRAVRDELFVYMRHLGFNASRIDLLGQRLEEDVRRAGDFNARVEAMYRDAKAALEQFPPTPEPEPTPGAIV